MKEIIIKTTEICFAKLLLIDRPLFDEYNRVTVINCDGGKVYPKTQKHVPIPGTNNLRSDYKTVYGLKEISENEELYHEFLRESHDHELEAVLKAAPNRTLTTVMFSGMALKVSHKFEGIEPLKEYSFRERCKEIERTERKSLSHIKYFMDEKRQEVLREIHAALPIELQGNLIIYIPEEDRYRFRSEMMSEGDIILPRSKEMQIIFFACEEKAFAVSRYELTKELDWIKFEAILQELLKVYPGSKTGNPDLSARRRDSFAPRN